VPAGTWRTAIAGRIPARDTRPAEKILILEGELVDKERERILVLEGDAAVRQNLTEVIQQSGYEALACESVAEGLQAARERGADVLLLDAGLHGIDCRETLAELKGSSATQRIRVILLVGPGAADRALGLDLGADDVVSRPWDSGELLARVRSQLRAKRIADDQFQKTKLAEEGQQMAQTAFQALAVTEKMTKDAFSLDRALKIGAAVVFAIALAMGGIFFLFSRKASKELRLSNALLARLESGVVRQQALVDQARKMRLEGGILPDASEQTKAQLQHQAEDLKARMANAGSNQVSDLQKQLAETNARLKRIEQEGQAGQSIIQSDVRSVCLLHITVAFRHTASGQRLRYAGMNAQGEPIHDSEGNPIFTLEGRGPEVHFDIFGTGFLAAPGGRVITNRHVAQPWWENDDMKPMIEQGLQPEIAEVRAYFPNVPTAFAASIKQISSETDLALIQVSLEDLKLPTLDLDARKEAAISGQPVVALGYATGLAAILARTDENTAQGIVKASGGDPKQILTELARQNLIRPLATQGHIGDVLPDKILFDAQTTHGGSGGPLFNQNGKVIGVTYAVLSGFGGSNFGIPIRFTEPLIAH
jgi:DNA-binding response OmpR family regulator/S1-C subfamily serine protease